MVTMVVTPLRKVAGLIGSLAATALLLALIHRSADLFNSSQELGGLQPLSF